MRLKNKFGAVKTEYNGRCYDSKAEARYAANLDLLQRVGKVSYWLPQVPIPLPGKTTYRVDFQIFEPDGRVRYVDVKGVETQVFRLKKRQVEALYPIVIEVVK